MGFGYHGLTSFQLRYLVKFAKSQGDRRSPPGFRVNERFSIDPTSEVVPNQIKDLEELLSKTENRV